MAVPVSKRSKNPFEVWLAAVNLTRYTMEITSNHKTFRDRYNAMVERINNTVLNLTADLWQANQISYTSTDTQEYQDRVYLQKRALTGINEMLFLIDLAGKVLHRDAKKTLYWASLARNVKTLTIEWCNTGGSWD